jgi:protease secretion system membrane fusion protein
MSRLQSLGHFVSGSFNQLIAFFKRGDGGGKDENAYVRLGWHILLWGFGGFIAWASFAPLDQGVPASAWIITTSNRQAVQPMAAGMVEEILVREGDKVRAGQVLVRLNAINAQVQDTALREMIEGLKAQAQGLEQSTTHKKKMLQSLREQLQGVRELVEEGHYARNRMLELERQYLQLNAAVADEQGNLLRVRKQIAEQLTKIKATEQDLANTELKAPLDGEVVNLSVFTKGGVINAGFKVMEIVPTHEALIVEGQLPVHLVDRAHAGESVEILFTAFNQNRTPHIQAQLLTVGADRILDERTGAPYFKVQAAVTPEGMKILQKLNLKVRPGMPVEMFIKTGERSLMSYLLKPITDRAHSALREE